MKNEIGFSEKNTFHFSSFDSEIVLNKYGFSYFSQVIQHILNLGKIRNGPKVASFDLLKRLIFFYLKSDFWQILRFQYITLFYCTQMAPNAPEMNKNHLFWVRTHFGCFKPWFGAIILLFYHSFWRRGQARGLADDHWLQVVAIFIQLSRAFWGEPASKDFTSQLEILKELMNILSK